MPGKRTDKLDEWKKLEEVIEQQQQVSDALAMAAMKTPWRVWRDDAWEAMNRLIHSGRLDANQIRLIRKLIVAVIRTERNCEPGEPP